jgi:hypothetical protein
MYEETLCNDCFDTGWSVDREGKSVCACISETEPYQMIEEEVERLRAENDRLKTALHDAINRPMGVVPESAEPFYEAERQE